MIILSLKEGTIDLKLKICHAKAITFSNLKQIEGYKKKLIYFAGADTADNLMGRSPRKIGLGKVSATGGSAPQAKSFLGIG